MVCSTKIRSPRVIFVDSGGAVCYHQRKENSILPFKISPVRLIKGAHI